MSHERRLRVKTLVVVFLMVMSGSVGNVFLKRGMDRIGAVELAPASLAHAFWQTVASATIWLGIAFLLTFFLLYLLVLSWADYSYVMPASAFGYAIVVFLGVAVLGESVSMRRWLGVALICIGVMLVGRTKPRTTEARA
jgi:drug/metabolite transporter (DMT)-like permease